MESASPLSQQVYVSSDKKAMWSSVRCDAETCALHVCVLLIYRLLLIEDKFLDVAAQYTIRSMDVSRFYTTA